MTETLTSPRYRLWSFLALFFLLLPWVMPYAGGPSPNVWPWLASAACAVFIYLLRDKLTHQNIALAWLIAALVSALIGVLQYFGLSSAFGPLMSQTPPGEAFANLRQRNQFATLTSIGLVALIALVSRPDGTPGILSASPAPGQQRPGANHLAPAYLWMAMLAIGNAASNSRTGLLQWLLVLALSAWWGRRTGYRLPAVFALRSVLAYFIAALALPLLLSLFTGLSSDGLLGRVAQTRQGDSRGILWSNVLTLIAQKPWLGWGWGELDYAHFITLYPGGRFTEILDNAHNLPLHLAVELGVPLALVICIASLWAVLRSKPWMESSPARQMAWGVLGVIMLHSLLEYPLWYGPFQIAFALSVALLWHTSGRSGQLVSRGSPEPQGLQKLLNAHAQQAGRQDSAAPGNRRLSSAMWIKTASAVAVLGVLLQAGFEYFKVSQLYRAPEARAAYYRDDTFNKVRDTWVFSQQLDFAQLSMTTPDATNAAQTYELALKMVHYSPEPRVVEKLMDSALFLGKREELEFYLARYKLAFPKQHAVWLKRHEATLLTTSITP